jgi:beta-glucanase (GH16 family)
MDSVTYFFNGAQVDAITKEADIPKIPMYLRLHSRSGWNDLLPRSPQPAFQAFIKSFEFTPL